ncbi:MAG: PadR family transcriptional regulator [Bacteroidota bacterium]
MGILGAEAYAFKIAEEFAEQTGRSASIGSVHSALSRMADKGFLTSSMGQPTASRGGRRKRIYEITAYGEQALRDARDLRIALWQRFPGFSLDFN